MIEIIIIIIFIILIALFLFIKKNNKVIKVIPVPTSKVIKKYTKEELRKISPFTDYSNFHKEIDKLLNNKQ